MFKLLPGESVRLAHGDLETRSNCEGLRGGVVQERSDRLVVDHHSVRLA